MSLHKEKDKIFILIYRNKSTKILYFIVTLERKTTSMTTVRIEVVKSYLDNNNNNNYNNVEDDISKQLLILSSHAKTRYGRKE